MVENRYKLIANIKHKRYGGPIPAVTANDNVIFEIELYDDVLPYDLTGVTRYTLVTMKKNKSSVIREGTLSNGLIKFTLSGSETTESGRVEGTVQLYDATNKRISSAPLAYEVIRDPSLQGGLPTDDKTLVIANESLMTESIEKSEQAMARVDELITKAPQPSEVVDARGGFPVLSGRLDKLSSDMAHITTQSNVIYFEKYAKENPNLTTDKDIIQSILNITGSKRLVLGNRSYTINSALVTSYPVEIVGQEGTVFDYPVGFNGVLLTIASSDVSVKNIKFKNNKPLDSAVTAGNYGISAANVQNIKLENVEVERNGSYGIVFNNVKNFKIHKCYVKQSMRDGIHCFNMCQNGFITNNIIEESGDDSIVVLSDNNMTTTPCKDIIIDGNIILKTRSRGININGAENIVISNNIVNDTKNAGILIVKEFVLGNKNINIINNVINDVGSVTSGAIGVANQFGINIAGSPENLNVSGNIIDSGILRGINVSSAISIVITNNTVKNNGATGIEILNVTKLICNNNIVENNIANGIYVKTSNELCFASNMLKNNGSTNQQSNILIESCNNFNVNNNYSKDDRVGTLVLWLYRIVYSTLGIVTNNNGLPSIAGGGTTNILTDLLIGTTAPTSTFYAEGQQYFDKTNVKKYVYANSVWNLI